VRSKCCVQIERTAQLKAPRCWLRPATSAHIILYHTVLPSACTAAAHNMQSLLPQSEQQQGAQAHNPAHRPHRAPPHHQNQTVQPMLPDSPHHLASASMPSCACPCACQAVPLCAWGQKNTLHSMLLPSNTAGYSSRQQLLSVLSAVPCTCAHRKVHTRVTPCNYTSVRHPCPPSCLGQNCHPCLYSEKSLPYTFLFEPAACSWPKTCPANTPGKHPQQPQAMRWKTRTDRSKTPPSYHTPTTSRHNRKGPLGDAL
jgi:hypothetical protein